MQNLQARSTLIHFFRITTPLTIDAETPKGIFNASDMQLFSILASILFSQLRIRHSGMLLKQGLQSRGPLGPLLRRPPLLLEPRDRRTP